MVSHGPVADPTPVHMEATPVEFSRLFTIYLLSIKVMQRWNGDPLAEQKVEGLWEGVGTDLYIIYRIYVRKFLKKKKGMTKGTCCTYYTKQVMPSGVSGVYLHAVYGLPRCCLSKIKCPKSSR